MIVSQPGTTRHAWRPVFQYENEPAFSVIVTVRCRPGASDSLANPFSCFGGSTSPGDPGIATYSSGTAQPRRRPTFVTLTATR